MPKENNQPQTNHYHFHATHLNVNFVDQGIGISQSNSAKQHFNENTEVAQLKNRVASLEMELAQLRCFIKENIDVDSNKKNLGKLVNENTALSNINASSRIQGGTWWSEMPPEIAHNLLPIMIIAQTFLQDKPTMQLALRAC